MAQILVHTSSKQPLIQSQALRLQQELQVLGHHVEYSMQTHPARILKNNYDVLHILSETHNLNLFDKSLLLAARLKNQMGYLATVVSSFEYEFSKKGFINQLQFQFIDAFSTSDLVSLKSHKDLVKDKFILPFFPLNKRPSIAVDHDEESICLLKVVSDSFDELLASSSADDLPTFVDASSLANHLGTPTARKKWRQFQNKNIAFKKAILVLKLDNVIDLVKKSCVLVDLSTLKNAFQFHTYLELSLIHSQFILLNKNQATGFPHFWKHQKNCWVADLHETEHQLKNVAKKFFKNKTLHLNISTEEKINELSRLYTKLMHMKALNYDSTKVSTT